MHVNVYVYVSMFSYVSVKYVYKSAIGVWGVVLLYIIVAGYPKVQCVL